MMICPWRTTRAAAFLFVIQLACRPYKDSPVNISVIMSMLLLVTRPTIAVDEEISSGFSLSRNQSGQMLLGRRLP
jgi:hypothetical protein